MENEEKLLDDLKEEERKHINNLKTILKRMNQNTDTYKYLAELIEKRKNEWVTTYLTEWKDEEEIYKNKEEITITRYEEAPVEKENQVNRDFILGKYIELVNKFNIFMRDNMTQIGLIEYLNEFNALKKLITENSNMINNANFYLGNVDKAITIINQKLEQPEIGNGR